MRFPNGIVGSGGSPGLPPLLANFIGENQGVGFRWHVQFMLQLSAALFEKPERRVGLTLLGMEAHQCAVDVFT